MVFSLGEKTKLARLQRLRRCIQAALQGTKTLLSGKGFETCHKTIVGALLPQLGQNNGGLTSSGLFY